MVSFSCEVCNDSMPKKKLMGHFGRCPQAVFTCIDCGTTFQGTSFQQHTSCVTEAEKYGHNKGVAPKPKQKQPKQPNESRHPQSEPKPEPKVDAKQEPKVDAKQESKADAKESKADAKKAPKLAKGDTRVRIAKQESLKKVLKRLRKEHKLSKDEILEKLIVLPDGHLELSTKK